MSDGVLVAIIGLAGTTLGAVFGYLGNSRKQAVLNAQREQEQQDQLSMIKEWMQRVDKKLDEHNGYAKKFVEFGGSIELIKQDVKYLKKGANS